LNYLKTHLSHPEEMSISFKDRVWGCWLGKSIGGTLGLPAEGRMERLNFSFYDPIPTTAPPNDDLELQLVWLDVVESIVGSTLTRDDFARAWRNHIHYMWDEYGRCRWNLRRGVPLENVGTFENPFHAGMGSPIRSEIWACLFAGDPESAAHYAALDASLDHGLEGIAGEVFFSAMQCLVAGGSTLRKAISGALTLTPSDSETARALVLVQNDFASKLPEWDAWSHLLSEYHCDNFTHAPLNVALTIWALLYGKEDFEKSVLLAVNGGYDTDCTAATAGATLGLLLGRGGIPEEWSLPIGEKIFIGPGIQGISAPTTLRELTDRTVSLIGKLDPQPWSRDVWNVRESVVDLSNYPGTISLIPLGKTSGVHWANGELPAEVKLAGGATWEWVVDSSASRELMCLASSGARLWIDGEKVLHCPGGLPYVPAPHRCPDGSRVPVNVSSGRHIVHLELAVKDADQQASVLLTYPNFHLCPWTPNELPSAAELQAV
jgi:ADP-ribosylglycohydrolase